ncbi:DUF6069 family protein [Antrihabitans sp. NCIMB 15449]|uniref:DUF6069 family protein n=1 Tax=Antrihabitans spumae TaxID=3373370 RepID=A0ABW7JVF4_9NOCA
MTATNAETSTATPGTTPYNRRALNRPQAVAFTVVAALVVNLVVWLVGWAFGGELTIVADGKTSDAAPGGVVIFTVVPTLIGMTAAAVLLPYWAGVVRVAQIIGPTLSILTIGLTINAPFDGPSTVSLSAMHVVIAIAIYVGLDAMQRGWAAKRRN